MNFKQLVQEVGVWSHYNFGDQSGLGGAAPMLGIVEELFEELPSAKTIGEADDAIADIFIFLADCFYRFGVNTDDLELDCPHKQHTVQQLHFMIGTTSKAILKYKQGVRGYDHAKLSSCLRTLFRHFVGFYYIRYGTVARPLSELVHSTWQEVKKRDWVKYPINGRTE